MTKVNKLPLLFLLLACLQASAQITLEWDKTFGGKESDRANSFIRTQDGGFALAGYTYSKGAGKADAWLIKTDARGNLLWDKTFGGKYGDEANYLIPTQDGGFALAGRTKSKGAGKADAWLLKTDARGNLLWDKTFGGRSWDEASSLIQIQDGGFALAGWTNGNAWLLKTDARGNLLWDKTFEGEDWGEANSLIPTQDGGFALAGWTKPKGEGSRDAWLIKTDARGNLLWDKTFGGKYEDRAEYLIPTQDGGFALAGYTYSKGAGNHDAWLIKTDAWGNLLWDKTFGGTGRDEANYLIPTQDGGFALAGWTYSKGEGSWDAWLIKTDVRGNLLEDKTLGGTGYDEASSLIQTQDGGFALAGYTKSKGAGKEYAWLIKVKDQNSYSSPSTVATNTGNKPMRARAALPPSPSKPVSVQNKSLAGQVSSRGKVLPGVTVKIKDTELYAITNRQGKFTVYIPHKLTQAIVEFSHRDHKTQSMPVGSQSQINVSLEANFIILTGQVSHENKPLAGVSIQLKGTSESNQTDTEGNYQLNIPLERNNPILQFSRQGYHTKFISVAGKTEINVSLEPSFITLTGQVKDKNNRLLPGVRVLLQEINTEQTTHANGGYKISIPENIANPSLKFSLKGYHSKTMAVAGKTNADVRLYPNFENVDIIKGVSAPPQRNRYALIIGNEEYKYFGNPKYANRDSRMFREYSERLLGIPPDNIFYLENGSNLDIKNELDNILSILKALGGKGELYFYYAGHMEVDEKDNKCIVASDVRNNKYKYDIKFSAFLEELFEIPTQRNLLFIDACYSGVDRTSLQNQELLASRGGLKRQYKKDVLRGNTIMFSASGPFQPSSSADELKHGIFTYSLLLELKKSKGNITLGTLAKNLRQEVSINSLKLLGTEQNPSTDYNPKIPNWKTWLIY